MDVYSFGVLLCEMCTSSREMTQELQTRIGKVNDVQLQRLIQRCVKKDPNARPSMSEVISDLEQLA